MAPKSKRDRNDGEELMDLSTTICLADTDFPFMKKHRIMLYCNICDVECSSDTTYKQHINGVKHFKQSRNKLKLTSNSSDASQVLETPDSLDKTFTCDLCKISVNSIDQLKCHQEGSKHRAKSQKLAWQEKVAVLTSGTPTSRGTNQKDAEFEPDIKTQSKEGNKPLKIKFDKSSNANSLITDTGSDALNNLGMECSLCGIKFSSMAQYHQHSLDRHIKIFDAMGNNLS